MWTNSGWRQRTSWLPAEQVIVNMGSIPTWNLWLTDFVVWFIRIGLCNRFRIEDIGDGLLISEESGWHSALEVIFVRHVVQLLGKRRILPLVWNIALSLSIHYLVAPTDCFIRVVNNWSQWGKLSSLAVVRLLLGVGGDEPRGSQVVGWRWWRCNGLRWGLLCLCCSTRSLRLAPSSTSCQNKRVGLD